MWTMKSCRLALLTCCIVGMICPAALGQAPANQFQADRQYVREGQLVWVGIYLKGGNKISSVNLTMEYNPAVAKVDGEIRGGVVAEGSLFQGNAPKPGQIKLGLARKDTLGTAKGQGAFAQVPFRAVGKAGEWTTLKLSVFALADDKEPPPPNPLPGQTIDGCLCILDKSGNWPGGQPGGPLTALDAMRALKMSVDLLPQESGLDVDKSGKVDATDAAIILRMVAKGVGQPGGPGSITEASCCGEPAITNWTPGPGGTFIPSVVPPTGGGNGPTVETPPTRPPGSTATGPEKPPPGGSQATVDSVAAALAWLAKHQSPDGHWDCRKYGGGDRDVPMTALALLCFTGHGNSELEGDYKDNVKRAVGWLLGQLGPDGAIKGDLGDAAGYHNPLVGSALAEATLMNRGQVPATRDAAQRMVDYACNVHIYKDDKGAMSWRYRAKQPGDISVTGWFVLQLHAARLAGLQVPGGVWPAVAQFLNTLRADGPDGTGYGYQGPDATPRRTAIGALIGLYTDGRNATSAARNFVKNGGVPSWDRCDIYYWYYGTMATFQAGGSEWQQWNDAMKKALVDNQNTKDDDNKGSWDPRGEYSGEWGRVGQTAFCCLGLEVYYRYAKVQPNPSAGRVP